MADERVTIEIRGVDRASGAIRSVSSALGRMSSIVGGLVAFRLLERLAHGIMSIGKAAMQAYEWFDRMRFSLTELARAEILDNMDRLTMTTEDWSRVAVQAGENARELLDWVIKLALTSPFAAEDVNRMFRLVRAYGFATDEARKLTETVLDFSAATGFGREVLERMGLALGQVRQRGRLAGEEIRQLINVGIPVRDIVAKSLGITTAQFEKLLRAGKIMASDALPPLLEWMERFAGASERAVQTWWGLLSNMKDVKELGLIALFEGIAKALTPALQSLFDYLTSPGFMAALTSMGERLGAFLVPFVEGLPKALGFLRMLSSLIKSLATGYVTPGGFIAYILSLMGIIESADRPAVRAAINNFVDGIGRMASKIGELAAVWVGPIVENLPGWLENISTISWETFQEFVPMFEHFIDKLIEMSEVAAPAIMEDLTDFLNNLTDWWEYRGADAAAIVEFLLTLTGVGILGGLAIFAALLGAITDILAGKDPIPRMVALFETLSGLADILAENQIFQDFAASISQLIGLSMLPYEEVVAATGTDVATWLLGGLTTGVEEKEEQVAADLVAFLDGVGYTAEHWGILTGEQKMKLVGKQMAKSLGDGFVEEAEKVEGRLEAALMRIIALVNKIYAIESPSKIFVKIGKEMMSGLAMGIEAGVKTAVKKMTKASRAVVMTARRELEVASPSRVMAEIGAEVTRGMAAGITAAVAAPAAGAAAAAVAGPAPTMPTPYGAAPTIVYAPTMSLADEKEFTTKLAPIITSIIQRLAVYRGAEPIVPTRMVGRYYIK